MSDIHNSKLTNIKKPKLEDFSLTQDQYSILEEELEIYNAEIDFKKDKLKSFFSKCISFIISSSLIIYGVLIIIALLASFIDSSFNVTKYDKIPYFVLFLFRLTFVIIVVMFLIKLIGIEYLIIKLLSIKKNSKYSNLHMYNKMLSEYKITIRLIDEKYWRNLSGRMFEIELANLFKSKGFDVNISKQGGDGGLDLILRNKDRSYIIGVQCKAHRSKISPHVARDLLGTIKSFKFDKGYLITLEGGTIGTIEFCKRNDIIIWDVNDIISFRLNESLTVDTFYESIR